MRHDVDSCALLVERSVFVVELNLFHFETATPLGLVPRTILQHAARVLLTNEELYRFWVVKLGERVQIYA